jgi:hypothetical protein
MKLPLALFAATLFSISAAHARAATITVAGMIVAATAGPIPAAADHRTAVGISGPHGGYGRHR